jgi:chromosome segregation ATPase
LALHQRFRELQVAYDSLDSELDDVDNQLRAKGEEVFANARKHTQEKKAWERTISQLQSDLDARLAEKNTLTDKVLRLEKDLDDTHAELDISQKMVLRITSKYESLMTVAESTKQLLQVSWESLARKNAQVDDLNNKIAALTYTNETALEQKSDELSALNQLLKSKDNEINAPHRCKDG